MRQFLLTLLLALVFVPSSMADNGGLVEANKLYNVPTGEFDIDYTTSETLTEGQTVVVFYYTNKCIVYTNRNFAFGPSYKEFSYASERDTDDNLIIRFYDTKNIVVAGKPLLINLYSPLEQDAQWAYVICNESEKETVADPFHSRGSDPQDALPGQTEATAFEIGSTPLYVTSPVSKISSSEYVIYAKFTAQSEGRAYFDMPSGDIAHNIKEEGGSYRILPLEAGFPVEKGVTYYVWYRYNQSVSGNISVRIEEPSRGESRSTAILISGNVEEELLGKESIGKEYFYNTTTWFLLDSNALSEMGIMTIKLSGGLNGEVALFAADSADPVKAYGIGGGSGMLPVNSTIDFDIAPQEHTYYVAITQDNVGGKVAFTFSTVTPGQTMGSAIEATLGANEAIAGNWYKYTHNASEMVSITNVSTVYQADGGLVAMGADVTSGFRMSDGQTVYFQANGNFVIKASEIPVGTVADNPLILELDENGRGQFKFMLSGSDSDATRYIKYVATQTGSLMYGTNNSQVLEMAFGSSVIDLTTGKRITVAQRLETYGYFTYTFPVVADHEYLIEQTLANNVGTVIFSVVFTPAAEGEVLDMPITLPYGEAYDLGRKASAAKYFCFVAPEAGDYQLIVNAQGYVRRYLADGSSYSIQRDYAGGTDFHNEVVTLAKNEKLLFSVEATADIEHLAGGVQDFFIANYFAACKLIAEGDGTAIERAIPASESTAYAVGKMPLWYGPITVPADERFTLSAVLKKASNNDAVAYITDEQGQWINNESSINYDADGLTHTYTMRPSSSERQIYILTSPVAEGAYWYFDDEPSSITSVTKQCKGTEVRYNLLGQPSSGRGVVVVSGKKYLVK